MIRAFYLLLLTLVAFGCQHPMHDYTNSINDYPIIPKPVSLEIANGRIVIQSGTRIEAAQDLEFEGNYLAEILSSVSGLTIPYSPGEEGNIKLLIDNNLASAEAYDLSVVNDQIYLTAKTPAGIFLGIQTLRQLLQYDQSTDSWTVPNGNIQDAPRYDYRGMHLDVCRHFFSTDFVKRYIDILAMHKINTFHWHLTEDQGWRIEIKQYPELTNIGAWRNGTIEGHYPGTANDNKKYGGFYTQEEVKEVIAYAAERHITIIPEIELPGHSSAAIAAYPFLSCFPEENTIVPNEMISEASKAVQAAGQAKVVQETWGVFNDVYCPANEETFTFIENVLEEIIELFPSEYIHIGGDECPKENWKRSSACQDLMQSEGLKDEHELQSYFIRRVEQFVNSKGKRIIGWDEILEGGLAPDATVMSWRGNEGGIAAARENHQVIMSPTSHCYFDYYQSGDRENEPLAIGGYLPVEKVYSFDPTPEELEASQYQYILGGQANLWTEYIPTESQAEYMLLPRLAALSEALWSPKESKDWEDFSSRLPGLINWYDEMGWNYAKHVVKSE